MDFHEDNKSVTKTIDSVAEIVVKYMSERVLSMSTAESCTGGALSEAITSVPGASNMFLGGAVTYSEELKRKLLGVKQETLEKYTVYSRETALEMSRGFIFAFLRMPAGVRGSPPPARGSCPAGSGCRH